MAGSNSVTTTVIEESELDSKDSQDLFVWDENSQLYFHASSGFYHEPIAGWYYSTRDGLYYKFEDGNYVLLDSDQRDKWEMSEIELGVHKSSFCDEQSAKSVNNGEDGPSLNFGESEDNRCKENGIDESNCGNTECINGNSPRIPPPSSEWLEETLIDMYLSGYSNQVIDGGDDLTAQSKTDEVFNVDLQADASGDTDTYELEEGEWIPEADYDVTGSSVNASDEGFSWEEENWRAQYGQVVQSSDESVPDIPAVDLWDWSMVKGSRKDGKGEITRLVGRLMRKSAKLHPSMPCGGGLRKTAPIREVHLDLVRVSTGQIYRLRNPSAKFLATLSTYCSSNPTKDWGFPELSSNECSVSLSKSKAKTDVKAAGGGVIASDMPLLQDQILAFEKNKGREYRDRAAERRALHGGFGIAPGQKNSAVDDHTDLPSSSTEEAAAEALNMSFGAGSYARRILEGMGWKQGEALGKTTKGLVEPIEAEGNIGSAGLGWPRGRSKRR